MEPTYKPGDLLTVDGQKPAIGDVAVALIDLQWVTHRVIAIEGETFILKGDIFESDQTDVVPSEDIIGRVINHQRDPISYKIRFLRVFYRLIPGKLRIVAGKLMPTQLKRKLRDESLQDIFFVSKTHK